VDSHHALPVLDDEAQLRRNLEPFHALIHADRLVMVAHLKTPRTEGRPASLHRGFVADNPFGFRARWIPDDMEMGGCAEWNWEQRVELALEAGHQALLVCQTQEGVQACTEAAARAKPDLVDAALARFRSFRAGLPHHDSSRFDQVAWEKWTEEVKAAAKEWKRPQA
jgi:beta-N-acetylhexosaminidase